MSPTVACLTDPPCARQEGRAPWAEPVRLAEHGLLPLLPRVPAPPELCTAAVPRRQVGQRQHLRVVHRAPVPCRREELRDAPRVPLLPRHCGGRNYPRVHDRHVDVLHACGTDAAGGLLV